MEHAKPIHESGQLLLRVINNILDVSRIDAGEVELSETRIDVGETLLSCTQMLDQRAGKAQVSMAGKFGDSIIKFGDSILISKALPFPIKRKDGN